MKEEEDLVYRILANFHTGALVSSEERKAVANVLLAGKDFGYGNMMAWLATAWAMKLRDEEGLSEKAAIEFVGNRSPYPLPPKET
jgi:hypothetical protein